MFSIQMTFGTKLGYYQFQYLKMLLMVYPMKQDELMFLVKVNFIKVFIHSFIKTFFNQVIAAMDINMKILIKL